MDFVILYGKDVGIFNMICLYYIVTFKVLNKSEPTKYLDSNRLAYG